MSFWDLLWRVCVAQICNLRYTIYKIVLQNLHPFTLDCTVPKKGERGDAAHLHAHLFLH